MIAQLLGDTPAWVIDGKNYLGFGGAVVAAFGLVWKYAIKPYREHVEAERKRALLDAAILRKGEITAALIPLQEQLAVVQKDVSRLGDKAILQGDAIHGINTRLDTLTAESRSLHSDVRTHMRNEDEARQRNEGDGK